MLGLSSTGHSFLADLVMYLVPMILSLSVHEYAHARAAFALGDDTAEREGRLTLSPLAHIDLIGTLLIPAINLWVGGFSFIGWAKPTPVRPEKFRRGVSMRTGLILTSVAGPLSNLILAVASIGLFALLRHMSPALLVSADHPSALLVLLRAMFSLNVGLCIFNLLPIPPLDGSRLLPRSMDGAVAAIAPYSFILLLVVINFGALRYLLLELPVVRVMSLLEALFGTSLMRGAL